MFSSNATSGSFECQLVQLLKLFLAVKHTPLYVEILPFSVFVVFEYKIKDTEFTSVLAVLLFF